MNWYKMASMKSGTKLPSVKDNASCPCQRINKIAKELPVDYHLVALVQEAATGRAVHDMAGVLQVYYSSADLGLEALLPEYETTLRLFLIDHDSKKALERAREISKKQHHQLSDAEKPKEQS